MKHNSKSPDRLTSQPRGTALENGQPQVPNVPTDFTEVFSWGSDRSG